MIKIIMHGCNGKMGQVISDIVEQDDNAVITAGIDIVDNRPNSYPVYTDIKQCDAEADVVIDFSSAAAVDPLMEYCEKEICLLYYVLPDCLKNRLPIFIN